MNLLLIGSGGREHAIARALVKSPRLTRLYIAPGNPGTASLGTNVPIKDTDIDGMLAFSIDHGIDLVMVGPEAPLVLGITDRFEAAGILIVGPNQNAAQLEGSKRWAKEKMKRYGIPTAAFESFTDPDLAMAYVANRNRFPIVIKADGLAAGKGVVIALCLDEANAAITDCMVSQKFETAGQTVVIEDFLTGEEASVFAFTDGKTVLPMVAAQDHKAIFDGDKGPNTGGMGAYSPAPIVTDAVMQRVIDRVLQPLVDGFQSDGIVYKGIIFAGLMIDNGNPYVIEYNARFGDPETQVVVSRLESDLLTVLHAVATQTLDRVTLDWSSDAVACVVLASGGYPGEFAKRIPISGIPTDTATSWTIHAGTTIYSDQLVTNGGRVFGAVGRGQTLQSAINAAYDVAGAIQFEKKYYRTDIGLKGLQRFSEIV